MVAFDWENSHTARVGYERIKRQSGYARGTRSRVRVEDYLALSPERDPYYADSPGRRRQAEWFAEQWQRFSFGYGTHLRRIHYRLISAGQPVTLWNGEPYENTEGCWQRLGTACASARYLELVPPDAISDHRNPPAKTQQPKAPKVPQIGLADAPPWQVSGLILADDPPAVAVTYPSRGRQRYRLELVCEKTTMNDILAPLCKRYEAALVTAAGEVSVTQMYEMARRICADGRPARILYVSDFDPAGATMPVSASRKLEFFLGRAAGTVDVELFPIALTRAQVAEYGIPRIPIKDSDLRRGRFERRYGAGGAELDAMEAVRPGLLAEIVEAALDPYFDHTLADRVADERRALEAAAREARERALAPFAERRAALRERVEALQALIAPQIAALTEEAEILGSEVAAAIEAAAPDVADFVVPEPEVVDEDRLPEPLFASGRDYLAQIDCYKAFQGKQSPLWTQDAGR